MKKHSVLAVDLDGTLLCGDLLHECVVRLLKHQPWKLFYLPFWLSRGLPYLKAELARHCMEWIDFAVLPYNYPLIEWVKQHPSSHKVLLSASHQSLVDRVARQTGCFDRACGTTDVNMKAATKVQYLQTIAEHFEYAGNSRADQVVWKASTAAYTTNYCPDSSVRLIAPYRPDHPGVWLKAVRWHQWLKNLLIFVPLIFGFRFFSTLALANSILAFGAFCCMASSAYLLNDLLDLDSDRSHPDKRYRCLASGRLSLPAALAGAGLLFVVGIGIASTIHSNFVLVLLLYQVLTVAYSFRLKAMAILDVLALACLYTIRIVAGAVATGIEASNWMLAFSVMMFFGLACLKRYTDLLLIQKALPGRNYQQDDLMTVKTLGISSNLLSILVVALYISSDEAALNYENSPLLWLLNLVLLYWVSIMWIRAGRQQITIDPVLYTLRDPLSWICLGAMVCTLGITVAFNPA